MSYSSACICILSMHRLFIRFLVFLCILLTLLLSYCSVHLRHHIFCRFTKKSQSAFIMLFQGNGLLGFESGCFEWFIMTLFTFIRFFIFFISMASICVSILQLANTLTNLFSLLARL